jgi:RNA 2',3'-cyclic 3'-phosphodiesterase
VERLFFALKPDPATCEVIAHRTRCLQRDLRLSGKAILPHHLHVTLHHLGDYPKLSDGLVSRASAAARELAALSCVRPFELTLDSAFSFAPQDSDPTPFAARVTGDLRMLFSLWEILGKYLQHAGVVYRRKSRSNYAPHVTLLYGDFRALPISFDESIAWTARDFVLIKSLLGQTKHVQLDSWALGASRNDEIS